MPIRFQRTPRTKADYVRKAKQTRPHTCHWPGCEKQVKPAMWGCKKHWFMLPLSLRNKIWETFQPGQEETMSPSEEYLQVANEAQRWIREHGQGK